MKLHTVRGDLHIHTCLSPCGELEMTPTSIIGVCRERNIDLIAVCDHNSAENVIGVQEASKGSDVRVLGGVEVTTVEEVHVLGIFDDAEQALKLQEIIYSHLLPGENNEDLFGIQVVANAFDEVDHIVKKLLIGGTTIPLEDTVDAIHEQGGLAIASHVDRDKYGIPAQLGMIPDNLRVDALEVSISGDLHETHRHILGADRYPLIRASDAHRLREIGCACSVFSVAESSVAEIRKALNGIDGRKIVDGGLSV